MPASLFTELERSNSGGLDDQRALQLALELSMLGLSSEDTINPNFDSDNRAKKSQNTTECVPVPSSEHVAEIVGRQGCKIKALRAKTNTYIKTPVRGEEPVFVVTGRKEDVAAAKREILSAAEHFSQIRAQRKNNLNGGMAPGPNSSIPGQTTIQVRVPYRVVGLVVGPKGATIKRIQQQTNTYIVTPSRDKEPVFDVTGLPENVEAARREIEAHIALRTGTSLGENTSDEDSSPITPSPFMTNGSNADHVFAPPPQQSSFNPFITNPRDPFAMSLAGAFPPQLTSAPKPQLYGGFSLYESADEGLGDSPTSFEAPLGPMWPPSSAIANGGSTGGGSCGTSTSSDAGLGGGHSSLDLLVRSASAAMLNGAGGGDRVSPTDSLGSLGGGGGRIAPTTTIAKGISPLSAPSRECVVCFESDIVAALVPCGHNMFCMECANRIVDKPNAVCPVCHEPASQTMRIYSNY